MSPIGPAIRRLFGPFETPITNAYRSFFVNLGKIAGAVQEWTQADSILEVGCGEGALIEHLARAFPQARITGIDISPQVGRLFRGDSERVRFRQTTIESMVESTPQIFDLVLVCDVLHHIPTAQRNEFLVNAKRSVRPGGSFVFKDWERRRNLVHLLGYASDRYLTGDDVHYESAPELRARIETVFGPGSIDKELRIPPWKNNLALFINS